MWRYLLADLHVHTVVSPCAEVEMIPPLIVKQACELGLEIIAITDHNTTANVAAVAEAARETGLTVLPGMEVQSREEVHLVCLFDQVEQATAWQDVVYRSLPDLENDDDFFGSQFIVDATGDLLQQESRLLSAATCLSVEQVVDEVRAMGGIVVAAHVDRPSNSLIRNLGFVPPGLALSALEISGRADPGQVARQWPQTAGWPQLVGGDAHRLVEMTGRTMFKVRKPTVAELALALAGREGRRVEISPHRGPRPS